MDRAGLIDSLDAPPPLKTVLLRAVAPNPNDRFRRWRSSVVRWSLMRLRCRAWHGDARIAAGLPANLTRTNPGLIAPGCVKARRRCQMATPLVANQSTHQSVADEDESGRLRPSAAADFSGQAFAGADDGASTGGAGLRTTGPAWRRRRLGCNTNPPIPGLTRTAASLNPDRRAWKRNFSHHGVVVRAGRVRDRHRAACAVTAGSDQHAEPQSGDCALPPPNQPQRRRYPLMVVGW